MAVVEEKKLHETVEFLQNLGLILGENVDAEEFTLAQLAAAPLNELEDCFSFNKEDAKKLYDALESQRSKLPKKSKRKGIAASFQQLWSTPKQPSAKQSFLSQFEDLSNIRYTDGNEWQMDPCSAANGGSSALFEIAFNRDPQKYSTYVNSKRWTPLMYGSALGRKSIVEILLRKEQDLCARNDSDQTALMIASSFGHANIIDLFKVCAKRRADKLPSESKHDELKRIIGLDLADDNGFTALHYAVFYNHHSAACYLLNIGANPNAPDNEGMTPTLLACEDEIQQQCLRDLFKAGGNLSLKNNAGKNGFDISNRESLRNLLASMSNKSFKSPTYGTF